MAPQDMDEANGKRQPAWKLRLPWEQQRLEEAQKSAFIQNETAEASTSSISTIARAFLLSRRRLRLDPDKKLHFLCKFQNLACLSLAPLPPDYRRVARELIFLPDGFRCY
jgi:hypothetical protein